MYTTYVHDEASDVHDEVSDVRDDASKRCTHEARDIIKKKKKKKKKKKNWLDDTWNRTDRP